MKLMCSIAVLAAILLAACSPKLIGLEPHQQAQIRALYQASIQDAAYPEQGEISNRLTPLSKNNPDLIWKTIKGEDYVLVTSWRGLGDSAFYKNDPKTGYYNTWKFPVWVTLAPYMESVCSDPKFGKKEGLDLRLKQLLGLPPNVKKHWVAEFWVRPEDLFRPCRDGEIDDTNCELCFPEKTDSTHKSWIDETLLASYYGCELYSQYPWTQLGYTYDWNKKVKDHVGLSEYVIGAFKNVVVKQLTETGEYCNRR